MEAFQKRITAEMDTVEITGEEKNFLPSIKVEVSDSDLYDYERIVDCDSSFDDLNSDDKIEAKKKRNIIYAEEQEKKKLNMH